MSSSDNQSSGMMKLKLDNYVRRSPDRSAKKPAKNPITPKQKEWLAYKCWEKCRNAYVKRMTASALLSDFEELKDLEGEAYINMWNILHKFDISHYKSKITDVEFFKELEKIPPFHRTETLTKEVVKTDSKGNELLDDMGDPISEIIEIEEVIPFNNYEQTIFKNIGKIITNYQKGRIKDYKDLMAEHREQVNEIKAKIKEDKAKGKTVKVKPPKLLKLTKKDCPLYAKLSQWIKDSKELDKSYKIIQTKLKKGFFDVPGQNKPKTLEFYFSNYYYSRVNFTACEARAMKKDRGTGPVNAISDEIPYNPEANSTDFFTDPQYEVTANLKYELEKEDKEFQRFFYELYFLRSYQKEMRDDYKEKFKTLKQRSDQFIQKIKTKYKIDFSGAGS